MDTARAAVKAIAAANAVAVARAVVEPALVAVTMVGSAAQAAEEPQAQAENLTTSATAPRMFGVSALNCRASAARKTDTAPCIAIPRRTR